MLLVLVIRGIENDPEADRHGLEEAVRVVLVDFDDAEQTDRLSLVLRPNWWSILAMGGRTADEDEGVAATDSFHATFCDKENNISIRVMPYDEKDGKQANK